MGKISSRELVLSTVKNRRTGVIPVDYMPARQTDLALRKNLGFSRNCSGEKELLDYLGVDLYYLSARDISQNEGFHTCWKKKVSGSEAERTCAFGIRWKREVGNAKFSVDEALQGPLEGVADPKDILSHPWPKREDFDFSPC